MEAEGKAKILGPTGFIDENYLKQSVIEKGREEEGAVEEEEEAHSSNSGSFTQIW